MELGKKKLTEETRKGMGRDPRKEIIEETHKKSMVETGQKL